MKLMISSLLVLSLTCLSICDEITDNTVEVKFYRLSEAKWTGNNMEVDFISQIYTGANTYCSQYPTSCGFSSWVSPTMDFKEIDVGKVSGYPLNDEKNMLHQFYINYPAGSLSYLISSYANRTVLPRAAVVAIVTATRESIHTAIGYWITEADSEYYGIPPPRLENSIIIPIAFLVLIIVIIVAIALHCWNKRREKEARIQKRIEEKKLAKSKAQVEPVKYKTEEETAVPTVDKKIRQKKNTSVNNRKDTLYHGDSGARGMDSPRKSQGGSDADSAIKMDDGRSNGEPYEKSAGKYQSLPPLSGEMEESASHEKKKKKKKKKHRHESSSRDQTTEL